MLIFSYSRTVLGKHEISGYKLQAQHSTLPLNFPYSVIERHIIKLLLVALLSQLAVELSQSERTKLGWEVIFFPFFHGADAHFVTRVKLIIDLYRNDNTLVVIALHPCV